MSNRNTNAHFELAPQVETERSTFSMDSNVKTTMNVGQLVPFYCLEVLPGDTFEIETAKVARLQTLLTPVMDNLYLDTYYFFVPCRLIWEHWKNFMGESERAWTPQNTYTIPQLTTSVVPASGTLWDYFGLPLKSGMSVSALPFRAYTKIVNDWFRDENLEDPFLEVVNDGTVPYVTNLINRGGKPYVCCKYHDYFTSCLPAPQKGPDVTFLGGYAPVVTTNVNTVDLEAFPDPETGDGAAPLHVVDLNLSSVASGITGVNNESEFGTVSDGYTNFRTEAIFDNLFANLGYVDSGSSIITNTNTINTLRQAFQIQRMLERDARAGTRLIEIIQAHFGVSSPDARMQRAEYLGGNRVPLNIQQVTQTSATANEVTPIGYQAGWSQTNDDSYDVNKSFTEHGYIIGLMVARYDHTYQQGVNRMWKRKTRYDYYWPALAHLGEQAVLRQEIYAKGNRVDDEQVFGYQEAWAEYRFIPNIVTGEMRSGISNTLDVWHFADYYEQTPMLSSAWIKENADNVDRTLAVDSSVSNQILVDIFIKNRATRPMPLYSIPGLIDHF